MEIVGIFTGETASKYFPLLKVAGNPFYYLNLIVILIHQHISPPPSPYNDDRLHNIDAKTPYNIDIINF